MSSKAPLRERALSNATKDWKPPSTYPLRIAKRDSPQPGTSEDPPTPALTPSRRRSVRNLAHGARVSNSPFVLSQLPANPARPSTFHATPVRRVSGEKRSRTQSMNDQAENENPAVRKRRQSQVSELLVQKRPVTNSFFKSDKPAAEKPRLVSQETPPSIPSQSQPPEPSPHIDHGEESGSDGELAPPPPPKEWFGRVSPHRSQSPSRPSLVSRRLHGPRMTRRHSRRKTVTFDEKCDVLEFDVEEESSNPFDWVTDDDDNYERNDTMNVDDPSNEDDHDGHDDDPAHTQGPLRTRNADSDSSLESFQVGDDSITGLVDSLLKDTRPSTPPQEEGALPEDLETEDGVPYGRSHHAERNAAAHHQRESQPESTELGFHVAPTASTPSHSREGTPITSISPGSHIPLGRSTRSERFKAQKEQEGGQLEEDVRQLPPSPSPGRPQSTSRRHSNTESLIPRFELDGRKGSPRSSVLLDSSDPLSYPQLKDVPGSLNMSKQTSRHFHEEHANLSIGGSEVSLSGLNFDLDLVEPGPLSSTDESSGLPTTSTPPTSPPNHPFMFTSLHSSRSKDSLNGAPSTPTKPLPTADNTRSHSPAQHSPFGNHPFARHSPRTGSPLARSSIPKVGSSSSLNGDGDGSLSGRSPRSTRETMQKRLEKQRSLENPLRESAGDILVGSDAPTPFRHSVDSPTLAKPTTPESMRRVPRRVPPPKITREPTHDGVVSLDEGTQQAGPPRPSLLSRSRSDDHVGNAESSSLGNLSDMKSALDRLMADVAGEATLGPDGKGVVGLKIEAVTEGIQAGRFTVPSSAAMPVDGEGDQSNHSISVDASGTHKEADAMDVEPEVKTSNGPDRGKRPESLLQANFLSPEPTGSDPPRATSPQPLADLPIRATSPQPSVNVPTREQLIKAMKQRQREQREEGYDEMDVETSVEYTPPPRQVSVLRPNRRRSKSASDTTANVERNVTRKRADTLMASTNGGLLDGLDIDEEDLLADSIDRELRRLKGPNHTKYHVRERPETIYASAAKDKVTHMDSAGDIDSGKAWRAVRRPSDMNEYAKQLKELKAQDTSGKAHGKVFVKVVGMRNLNVPIPPQHTAITCTLNNGIHYVTTPTVDLARDCQINQEFELVEHSKLEFTLTIKVRIDPHIKEQFKANCPPPRPAPVKIASPPPPKAGGMSRFFGGQKKAIKAARASPVAEAPAPQHKLQENLARYLTTEGSLAKAFISFPDIARRCDTQTFETSFPLIGQKSQASAPPKVLQVGELVLQIFRLPPLPGVPLDQLPQSLEECRKGLSSIQWHKITYYEGTLTQYGGDCGGTWRRRQVRIVGASMVAYNDITRKPITTIDLKKAVAVQDDHEPHIDVRSPASAVSAKSSRYIDHDGPSGVERSFRLIFNNKEEITFYTDTDGEKEQWLSILRSIVGRIPPNPLWAVCTSQRQEEMKKRKAGALPQPQGSPTLPAAQQPNPSRTLSPVPPSQQRRPPPRRG
ncbi:hypothetical protein BDY19DRAFT_991978 [Irpex rosettiformis]|uniref:Uncharacterized protein n=1 Tax=Irpex rosettiformis TaxID=378272 RepID=A0ACB8U8K2_9APHY|nr:hypothetical protein BDY19DRAFT_991978 [Irpex rosettiformis]